MTKFKKDKIEDFIKIVTLCGSTRFKDTFFEVMKKLTLEGKIVILPGVFIHQKGEEVSEEQKRNLDNLHFRKIDLSHSIYVIDVRGYIGESTRKEIQYAKLNNKNVRYYSKETQSENRNLF